MLKDRKETLGRERLLFAVLLVLIAALFVLFILYFHFVGAAMVNSDDASELILAKILSEEGGILSKNWYYSTELRVLNTQLVFAPLFSLTDNWHCVRVVGVAILVAILALSVVLLGSVLGLGRIGTAVLVLIFLVPFSGEYGGLVLGGVYYIPHLFITFVTISAVFTLPRLWEKKRKGMGIALNAAVLVLALVAGLGGLRQLLILYIPLLMASVVLTALEWRALVNGNGRVKLSSWTVQLLGESLLLMLFSGIGVVINVVFLRKTYEYIRWGRMQFIPFSVERLLAVFQGFLGNLGYREGDLFSTALLYNALCAGIVFLLIAALVDMRRDPSFSREAQALCVFFLSGLTAMGGLYAFTDMTYLGRYILPVSVLAFPIIVSWLHKKMEGRFPRAKRAAVAAGLAVFLALSLSNYRVTTSVWEKEQFKLTQALCEQGCRHGYATFWNANMLTELSNGQLEMWTWNDSTLQDGDVSSIFHWLQSKQHVTPPEGEVFCVFSADQWEMPAVRRLEGAELLYESDGYRAYRFPSFEAMKNCFADRSDA